MAFFTTPVRISLFFAASFVPFGVQLPFYPVLLAGRGLDAEAIALVTTVPIVLRFSTASLLGSFADRLGDRRLALVLYAAATLLGVLTVAAARDVTGLLLATALFCLPWNGILPVTDALATGAVRRGEAVYGRMRVWGSIAFVSANLAAGVVAARHGEAGILAFLIAGFAMQFAAAFALPRDRVRAERPAREGMMAGLASVAADRRLMAVFVGVAILQSSHAMLYGFSSLHWTSLGFSGGEIGLFWATGVIGEIALFAFSGAVLTRIGARGLIVIGAIGGVVRWTAFPFLGGSAAAWIGLQLLHAATFAAIHLGTMTVVARAVEERRAATAQGMMVSINGIAMALATLASGPLYHRWGGGGFAAMAVLAAVGGVVLTAAAQPHSAGSGGKTFEPS
jgi:PPP family 3-phenylpropionic acid transporter